MYLDAVSKDSYGEGWNSRDLTQKSALNEQGLDLLRRGLGHPFNYCESVQCLVVSVHGMDTSCISDRFLVASRLWAEGVSAEYLPQSGVILNLLQSVPGELNENAGASEWSLMQLFGVCSILKIDFVVIVQKHLLNDKNSVRLRRVAFDAQGLVGSEMLVSLDDLSSTILGETGRFSEIEPPDQPEIVGGGLTSSIRDVRSSGKSEIECIYVDRDQYYGNDREVSKNETPQWKTHYKAMKSVKLAAETYLSSLGEPNTSQGVLGMPGIPVFAASDLSFWVLRDFGTALMRRERKEESAAGACGEIIERYPKHKRSLKTLASAVDNFMKRHGAWGRSDSNARLHRSKLSDFSLMTVLFYSKPDNRFDTVTLTFCQPVLPSSKRKT